MNQNDPVRQTELLGMPFVYSWGRTSVPRVTAGTGICKRVTRSLVEDEPSYLSGPNSRVQRSIVSEEARPRCSSVRSNSSLRVRASFAARTQFSSWQIFYSTVRGLTKFKARRSLSDEYDGELGDWISRAFDSFRR